MSSLLNGAIPTSADDENLRGPTSFHNISSGLIEPTSVSPLPAPSFISKGAIQGSSTPELIAKEVEGSSSTQGTINATPESMPKDLVQNSSTSGTGNDGSTVISDFIPTTALEFPSTTSPSALPSPSSTFIVSTISSISTAIISSTSIVTPQSTPTIAISTTVVSIATPSSQNAPAIRPLLSQNQNPPVPESPTAEQIPSPSPSPSPSLAPSQLPSSPEESIQGNQVVSVAAKGLSTEPSRAPPSIDPSSSAESGVAENGIAPVETQLDNGITQPTDKVNPASVVATIPPATTVDAPNTTTLSTVIPDAVITAISTVSDAKASTSAIATTATGSQGKNDQPVDSPGDSGSGAPGIGATGGSGDSGSKPPMAAIVGGIIGGVAAVSLLALLLWLWRRNVRKNRQRSLFTPPGENPSMEKKTDEDNRGGKGVESTTWAFGLATMLGLIGKIFSRTSKSTPGNSVRGINMDRGNSQLLEAVAVDGSSIADRPGHERITSNRYGPDDFRVGLGLSFDNIGEFNPFSDTNAVASGGGGPGSRSNSRLSDPFADSNILPPPAVRPTAERRSRGRSLGGLRSFQSPAMTPRPHSVHRESLQSNDSLEQGRSKFRSDPFDLELGSHLIPAAEMPRRASSEYSIRTGHVRPESYTSEYVSGASLNEWSEPGPDIGRAMTGRRDSPTLTNDEPRQFGERTRRQSDGPFDVIVGQAL